MSVSIGTENQKSILRKPEAPKETKTTEAPKETKTEAKKTTAAKTTKK